MLVCIGYRMMLRVIRCLRLGLGSVWGCPLGDPCPSLYALEEYGYKESILFGTIQYLAMHADQCRARLDLVGWATSDGATHVLSCGYRGSYPPQLVPERLVSFEQRYLEQVRAI